MFYEVNSNTLGNVGEITAIMPIRQGFVDHLQTISYATRLRAVLATFQGLRRKAYESRELRMFVGPTELLRVLFAVRWMIFDNDQKLMLTVDFDGPWEPYIRRIVTVAGPVLDVILCHCENYEQYSTDQGYEKFAQWVHMHQEDCEFFYTANARNTIDDIAFDQSLIRKLSAVGGQDFEPAATLHSAVDPKKRVREVARENPALLVEQGFKALEAFYRLTPYFRSTSKPDDNPGARNDGVYLWRAASRALDGFDFVTSERVDHELRDRYSAEIRWARESGLEDLQASSAVVPVDPAEGLPRYDLQAGTSRPFPANATHGALVFVSFADRQQAAEWMRTLNVESDASAKASPSTITTISFTYDGLRRAGLDRQELASMPRAFRQGMALRGPQIGDIQKNHPDQWELPFLLHPDNPAVATTERLQLSSVDAMVSLRSTIETVANHDHLWNAGHELYKEVAAISSAGVRVLAVQPLRRHVQANAAAAAKLPEAKANPVIGHFGMVDGKSEPTLDQNGLPRDKVNPGDLLVGHVDSRKENYSLAGEHLALNQNVSEEDLQYNGSFLVVRKLEQDVAAFDKTVSYNAKLHHMTESAVKQKMFGRYPDGKPPEVPSLAGSNDFDYTEDPEGTHCPRAAHIRRANPRTNDEFEAPRIFRRGFGYGPHASSSSSDARGIMFMALNASIEEQFEVVQRWCAGGNSTGLSSRESDPILGVSHALTPRSFAFPRTDPITGEQHTTRFDLTAGGGHDAQFVTLRWGLYLFQPAISKIQKLIDLLAQPAVADPHRFEHRLPERVPAGGQHLPTYEDYGSGRVLPKLSPPGIDPRDERFKSRFKDPWKAALEDPSARGAGITEGIWRAVASDAAGVRVTPYGVLVARTDQVDRVLEDHSHFSVEKYQSRLHDAEVGDGFVGMDPSATDSAQSAQSPDRYQQESRPFKQAISDLSTKDSFNAAFTAARGYLSKQLLLKEVGGTRDINLRYFTSQVIGELLGTWFGLKSATATGQLHNHTEHFRALAGFVFRPTPKNHLKRSAKEGVIELRKAAKTYLADAQIKLESQIPLPETVIGPLLSSNFDRKSGQLIAPGGQDAMDYYTRTLVGTAQGFAGPTSATFLSIADTLLNANELWRLKALLANQSLASFEAARDHLEGIVWEAMRFRPVPEAVYRVCKKPTSLAGVDVQVGDKVIVLLKQASETRKEMLFGGAYEHSDVPSAPVHACPGMDMAIGTLLGMLAALLELPALQPGPSRLIISVANK